MWELRHVRLPMRDVAVMRHDPICGYCMRRVSDNLAERFAGYSVDAGRLWGSEFLARLGLWWLPQLAGHSLLVPADSLTSFREECVLALRVTEELAIAAGCRDTDIRQALQNFVRSASEGEMIGGWIEIS